MNMMDEDNKLKEFLFDKVVREQNWEEVMNTYKEDRRAHTMDITKSRDTALHWPSCYLKEVVEKLVKSIIKKDDDNNINNNNVMDICQITLIL